MEVEAESIAYIACQHLGLDTSDYSLDILQDGAVTKNYQNLNPPCRQSKKQPMM